MGPTFIREMRVCKPEIEDGAQRWDISRTTKMHFTFFLTLSEF